MSRIKNSDCSTCLCWIAECNCEDGRAMYDDWPPEATENWACSEQAQSLEIPF